MEENKSRVNYNQEENAAVKKQSGTKFIQIISVLVLPFLWIGYFYSLYRGNTNDMSSLTPVILIFSLVNSDILFSREKMENRILNILAKIEGILLVAVAVIAIVNLIIK